MARVKRLSNKAARLKSKAQKVADKTASKGGNMAKGITKSASLMKRSAKAKAKAYRASEKKNIKTGKLILP